MTGYPVGRPDLNGKEEQYGLQAFRENAKRISDEGISPPTFVGMREPDATAICGILRRLV